MRFVPQVPAGCAKLAKKPDLLRYLAVDENDPEVEARIDGNIELDLDDVFPEDE